MRDHFIGSDFKNCNNSSQGIPIGKSKSPTEAGVTHYWADNITNNPTIEEYNERVGGDLDPNNTHQKKLYLA